MIMMILQQTSNKYAYNRTMQRMLISVSLRHRGG